MQEDVNDNGLSGAVSINPGGLDAVSAVPVERGASSITALLPGASLRSSSMDPAGLQLPCQYPTPRLRIPETNQSWHIMFMDFFVHCNFIPGSER